jgi:hypothetical protein
MSGYRKDTGFFRTELDEAAQAALLPNRIEDFPVEPARKSSSVRQEYFIVNFDSSAFIGINQPRRVTPFEQWDAASFNSAYAVDSEAAWMEGEEFISYMLNMRTITPEHLGLSDEEFAFYTDYGGDERLKALAERVVLDFDGTDLSVPNTAGRAYLSKITAVYEFLKQGEYRYSLKPGIAPDGDQLGYFLYESKKGYCSYFAFAFTLMLRALGIPARAAAGFFTDPQSEAFGYFPVRSDMAHAWVEARVPGYGWVEFDPTTDQLAAGEEFTFSSGIDPDVFNRLMQEILENHSKLKPKNGGGVEDDQSGFADFAARAMRTARRFRMAVLIAGIVILFLLMRARFFAAAAAARVARRKAAFLWRHTLCRLRLAGYGAGDKAFASEFARAMDARVTGVYGLYLASAQARFAPDFSAAEYADMKQRYRAFDAAYKQAVGAGRRVLAWVFPPLALVLKARQPSAGNG